MSSGIDRLNEHAAAASEGPTYQKIITTNVDKDTKIAPLEKNPVCAKCGNPATHLANMLGSEKYRCTEHNRTWTKKMQFMPSSMWFSKDL